MLNEKKVIQSWLFYVGIILTICLLFELNIIEFALSHLRSAFVWGLILVLYIIGFEILNIALYSLHNNIYVLTIIYAVKELITIFLLTIIIFFFTLSFYSYKPDVFRDEFLLIVFLTLIISTATYWLYTKLDLGNLIEVLIKKVVELIFKSSNSVPLSKELKTMINPRNIEKIIIIVGIVITILIAANSIFNNISNLSLQEQQPAAFDYEIMLFISILSVYGLNIYLLLKSLDFNEYRT
ncbi:hypothetical protein [Planomicrobium sp. CPCC 101110]|uniref:hypothetical protein n=1 Tax=Planomicrobium sp. CPCC 101110 TaxID=2599619 RepID=UPI0011B6C9C7|nr:hypothetical protein [Planomicrobium sp. CPCC 101110]TWT25297.1 hypothetical protein FQV30_13115 [Planomicrobium sp. CPCC 101110]